MTSGISYRGRRLKNPQRERITRHERSEGAGADGVLAIDWSKPVSETFQAIVTGSYSADPGDPFIKRRRLAHLNNFVRLLNRFQFSADVYGVDLDCLLKWLAIVLVDIESSIRACALRIFRRLLVTSQFVHRFYALGLPVLCARSFDVVLDNHEERSQLIRLILALLPFASHEGCPVSDLGGGFPIAIPPHTLLLPPALLAPLLAVVKDGVDERDTMYKAALATLCEIVVRSPSSLLACSVDFDWLARAMLCCQDVRLAEVLGSVFVRIASVPEFRIRCNFREILEELIAPLCDPVFVLPVSEEGSAKDANNSMIYSEADEPTLVSRELLISLVRSWPGLILSSKAAGAHEDSIFKRIIDPFYRSSIKLKENLVDLLYELFNFSYREEFFVSWISLVEKAGSTHIRSSHSLSRDFVVGEAKACLPSLNDSRLSVTHHYLAMLMTLFIDAGITGALFHASLLSDESNPFEQKLSLKCLYLLALLLHKAGQTLPVDWTQLAFTSHAGIVQQENPGRDSALAEHEWRVKSFRYDLIVQRCEKLIRMLSQTKRPRSLALTSVINRYHEQKYVGEEEDSISEAKDSQTTSHFHSLIKDSTVLQPYSNCSSWDWALISMILFDLKADLKAVDNLCLKFLDRLLKYFIPSSNEYSRQSGDWAKQTQSGIYLIGILGSDHLNNDDKACLLEPLISEINASLSKDRLPTGLFSLKNMLNSPAQDYFLFIGEISSTRAGRKLMEQSKTFQRLFDLIHADSSETFVKLIVSTLDYSVPGPAHLIMKQALMSTNEKCRIYCTEFIGYVILRLNIPNTKTWAVERLIQQLGDPNSDVRQCAATVLEEVLHNQRCCAEFMRACPDLTEYGSIGTILRSFMFTDIDAVKSFGLDVYAAIGHWKDIFNETYVCLVDECIHSALTSFRRSANGSFIRRSSSVKAKLGDGLIPTHLFGVLSKTHSGLQFLRSDGCISYLLDIIFTIMLDSERNILRMKAALWALAHILSNHPGVELLGESLIPVIVKIAEECPVLAISGTAFFAMGLLTRTHKGRVILAELGWECVGSHYSVTFESSLFINRLSGGKASASVSPINFGPGGKLKPRYLPPDIDCSHQSSMTEFSGNSNNLNSFYSPAPTFNSFLLPDSICEEENGMIYDFNYSHKAPESRAIATGPPNSSILGKMYRSPLDVSFDDVFSDDGILSKNGSNVKANYCGNLVNGILSGPSGIESNAEQLTINCEVANSNKKDSISDCELCSIVSRQKVWRESSGISPPFAQSNSQSLSPGNAYINCSICPSGLLSGQYDGNCVYRKLSQGNDLHHFIHQSVSNPPSVKDELSRHGSSVNIYCVNHSRSSSLQIPACYRSELLAPAASQLADRQSVSGNNETKTRNRSVSLGPIVNNVENAPFLLSNIEEMNGTTNKSMKGKDHLTSKMAHAGVAEKYEHGECLGSDSKPLASRLFVKNHVDNIGKSYPKVIDSRSEKPLSMRGINGDIGRSDRIEENKDASLSPEKVPMRFKFLQKSSTLPPNMTLKTADKYFDDNLKHLENGGNAGTDETHKRAVDSMHDHQLRIRAGTIETDCAKLSHKYDHQIEKIEDIIPDCCYLDDDAGESFPMIKGLGSTFSGNNIFSANGGRLSSDDDRMAIVKIANQKRDSLIGPKSSKTNNTHRPQLDVTEIITTASTEEEDNSISKEENSRNTINLAKRSRGSTVVSICDSSATTSGFESSDPKKSSEFVFQYGNSSLGRKNRILSLIPDSVVFERHFEAPGPLYVSAVPPPPRKKISSQASVKIRRLLGMHVREESVDIPGAVPRRGDSLSPTGAKSAGLIRAWSEARSDSGRTITSPSLPAVAASLLSQEDLDGWIQLKGLQNRHFWRRGSTAVRKNLNKRLNTLENASPQKSNNGNSLENISRNSFMAGQGKNGDDKNDMDSSPDPDPGGGGKTRGYFFNPYPEMSMPCVPVDVQLISTMIPNSVGSKPRKSDSICADKSPVKSWEQLRDKPVYGIERHMSEYCLRCRQIGAYSEVDFADDESGAADPSCSTPVSVRSRCETQRSERSGGSLQSREVEEYETLNHSSNASHRVRLDILRMVCVLDVRRSYAERGLLRLKSLSPDSFTSLCLYSDISYLLGECRFRLVARRFLQELFQDVEFQEMFPGVSLPFPPFRQNSDDA